MILFFLACDVTMSFQKQSFKEIFSDVSKTLPQEHRFAKILKRLMRSVEDFEDSQFKFLSRFRHHEDWQQSIDAFSSFEIQNEQDFHFAMAFFTFWQILNIYACTEADRFLEYIPRYFSPDQEHELFNVPLKLHQQLIKFMLDDPLGNSLLGQYSSEQQPQSIHEFIIGFRAGKLLQGSNIASKEPIQPEQLTCYEVVKAEPNSLKANQISLYRQGQSIKCDFTNWIGQEIVGFDLGLPVEQFDEPSFLQHHKEAILSILGKAKQIPHFSEKQQTFKKLVDKLNPRKIENKEASKEPPSVVARGLNLLQASASYFFSFFSNPSSLEETQRSRPESVADLHLQPLVFVNPDNLNHKFFSVNFLFEKLKQNIHQEIRILALLKDLRLTFTHKKELLNHLLILWNQYNGLKQQLDKAILKLKEFVVLSDDIESTLQASQKGYLIGDFNRERSNVLNEIDIEKHGLDSEYSSFSERRDSLLKELSMIHFAIHRYEIAGFFSDGFLSALAVLGCGVSIYGLINANDILALIAHNASSYLLTFEMAMAVVLIVSLISLVRSVMQHVDAPEAILPEINLYQAASAPSPNS